ncbi:uncharacterized protein LY89DRAFT_726973 [Mollisia scopiformis]|uniref:CFEM domain-containing protein n=1 Tax=Mollisia scopiformis TaxID=149040 RepID=A0A194XUN7_MOLSC|nr:uncharacterized protein LY89DRAFT_726973 [Mollisia scopiformis]KUJ23923.1 hypothetical protein LY89DRAFT_726973 [Mollisia scopiformis]
MRLFCCLIIALLSTFSLAKQATDAEKEAVISTIPPCGLECILPTMTEENCSIGNLTQLSDCLCLHLEGLSTIATCIFKKCNYTDLVVVEKATEVLCEGEPRPDRKPELLGTTIALAIIVLVFVGLRFWSRFTVSRQFWWDDWFVLLGTICQIGTDCAMFWGISMGFGVHVWNVDSKLNVPLYQFEWIFELLYVVVQSTTKASIVCLYWRLFPQPWLRNVVRFLWVWIAIHFFTFFFTILVQCTPIALVYNHALTGHCLNAHAIILAAAILVMVEDIILIILPLPLIWKLNVKLSRKLAISLVMSVGLVAVVASAVRLKYVVSFYYDIDQNWDDVPVAILSVVETSLSIVCVCFPPVKILMSKYYKKYTGSDSSAMRSRSREDLLARLKGRFTRPNSPDKPPRFSIPWIQTLAPRLPTIPRIGSHIELEKGKSTVTSSSTASEANQRSIMTSTSSDLEAGQESTMANTSWLKVG